MLKSIIPSLALITFSSLIASSDMANAMDEVISEATLNQGLRKPTSSQRPAYKPTLSAIGDKKGTGPRKPSFQPSLTPLVEKNETSKTLTSPRKEKPKNKDPK